MRHSDKVKKLGRTHTHRVALMRNLVTALIRHERIRTTLAKAKVARNHAERLIRFAATGTLAARREVAMFIPDRGLVKKLFADIAPRFASRAGGCTRVYRLGPRPGDAAEMALLELVVRKDVEKPGRKDSKAKEKPAARDRKKPDEAEVGK